MTNSAIREFNGTKPSLGQRVFVDTSSVVLGKVSLAEDSSVWPCTVIRGDVHKIRIGQRSNIQDGSVLHVTHQSAHNPKGSPLTLGNDVTVGHKAVLHGCTIGNQVLIGMGAIVLDDAVIEDRVLLAAGSLVSPGKRLESGWLYCGAPARPVRKLSPQELDFFAYSANQYVDLKNQYLKQTPKSL